jgi:calpain
LNVEELFEDPEFPCNDDVLKYNDKSQSYRWLRPSDIATNPKFSIDGLTRLDVKQGSLGDCWLVSAISSLADKKKFLNRVVCSDNTFDKENYAGIFHFRFWKFGEWIDVVIDDRLPVDEYDRLVYTSSSNKKEFWPALLEKAYAKFRGSYKNIDGGLTEYALQDFSGGIIETHFLGDLNAENAVEFFKSKLRKNALLGAAITDANTDKSQLPSGHAYTITGAAKYKSNKILIRVRNPWGNATEWKGAWSDESQEWKYIPDEFKNKIGFEIKQDGEFWMSYEDFLKNFSRITVCNLSPDENDAEVGTKKWQKVQFKGEWVAGVTAGGSMGNIETYHFNPQYLLTLDEPRNSSVVIAMLQRENFPKRKLIKINFDVYKVEGENIENRPMKKGFFTSRNIVGASEYSLVQETHVRLELSKGKYLIVPSTNEPDVEGEFLIRVFADSKLKIEEFDRKVEKGKTFDVSQKSAIELLFQEHVKNERMNWKDLKNILDIFLGAENTSKHLSRSIIAMMSKDYSKTINLEQFKKVMGDIGKWKVI